MIELTVSLTDKVSGRKHIPLYLTTWTSVSPDAVHPILGGWSCTSPYLGAGFFGQYYVLSSYDWDHWYDDPTTGLKAPHRDHRALFLDFGKTEPFLILDGFNFALAQQLKLMGQLLQRNATVDPTVFWWVTAQP
ncbi:MAG: hypothetical protein U0795_26425 [Pirellulales bacterium]